MFVTKKIIATLLTTVVIMGVMPMTEPRASNFEAPLEVESYTFDDKEEVKPELFIDATGEEAPDVLSKEDIEEAQRYAEEMTQKSKEEALSESKDGMQLSGDPQYYVWKLQSSTVLSPYSILSGKYYTRVPTNTTSSKTTSFTVSLGKAIKGFNLSAAVNITESAVLSGPSSSDMVGNTPATHRVFTVVGYGKIVKNVYKVYDDNGATYLYDVTQTVASGVNSDTFSNNIHVVLSNGNVRIKSSSSSNVKILDSMNTYISKLNSSSCVSYMQF